MKIESFSASKYRQLGKTGDDVLLIVPNRIYAVLDGATDTSAVLVGRDTPGRFAAMQAALAMTEFALSTQRATMHEQAVWQMVNAQIAKGLREMECSHVRAITTMAAAVDCGDCFRFFVLGDTGLRINGAQSGHQPTKWVHMTKDIDRIFTSMRVKIYQMLQAQPISFQTVDDIERATRSAVVQGLDETCLSLNFSKADVQNVMNTVLQQCADLPQEALEDIPNLVQKGIGKGQYFYGNLQNNALGFAILNGQTSVGKDMCSFVMKKSEVNSLEIFSDGYFAHPKEASVAAWEALFAEVERLDPSKTLRYPSVKGSTSTEFSDDRTVVVVNF